MIHFEFVEVMASVLIVEHDAQFVEHLFVDLLLRVGALDLKLRIVLGMSEVDKF